jgi:hypothetical protein
LLITVIPRTHKRGTSSITKVAAATRKEKACDNTTEKISKGYSSTQMCSELVRCTGCRRSLFSDREDKP